MPLPWLIGAAVVAAAAVVAKVVTDDDSSSSSSSSSADGERRKQEREARLQRERDGLAAQLANLKKNRLEDARKLLVGSAEALEKRPGASVGLTASKFEVALKARVRATSPYAQALGVALSIPDHVHEGFTQDELDQFLVNLQVFENLYAPVVLGAEEQQGFTALQARGNRLQQLQRLKNQIEQQRE